MRPNDDLAHEGVAMAITIERPRKRGGKSFYRQRLLLHRLAENRNRSQRRLDYRNTVPSKSINSRVEPIACTLLQYLAI